MEVFRLRTLLYLLYLGLAESNHCLLLVSTILLLRMIPFLLPNRMLKHTKPQRPLEPISYNQYVDKSKSCIANCLKSYVGI